MAAEQIAFARSDQTRLPGVRLTWGFGWRGKLDAAIRGALSFGFLGTAVGGVITEKFYHIAYEPSEQWHYALVGSAVGAIFGIVWGSYNRSSK